MKKLTFIVALSISLMALSLFAADVPNFSGTWLLDESKVDTTQGPSMEAKKIIIKQTTDSLAIDRFLSNPMMGDFTIAEKITLDGKLCVSNTDFGTRKSTAVWSTDKKELTISSTIIFNWDGQDREMKVSEILGLEKEGAVLKIQATRDTPMGEMKTTVYYNKSK
jgi:hypothetical protein